MMCGTLSFLLDNIYIGFGIKLYRQIAGFAMGTKCAPVLVLRDLINSFSDDNQPDII